MIWKDSDVFWPQEKKWLMDETLVEDNGVHILFHNPYSLNNGLPILTGCISGNGPAWSLPPMERPQGSQVPMMQPPPPRIAATSQANQNFLFQPGPSPLEKLLQQNPKPPQ